MNVAGDWSTLKPPLSEGTLKCLKVAFGFASMTPVQASVIPLFMSNKDVAVEAVTGSGKTMAFVVPVVEILRRRKPKLEKSEVGAIILSPVRDLALQTYSIIKRFIKHCGASLTVLSLVGGGGHDQLIEHDIQQFNDNGGNVIVATPGRLNEFLQRLPRCCKQLEVLVFDEADRLLDPRFAMTIDEILSKIPKSNRRTGLFSATQTKAVEDLIRVGLRNPVRLTVKVASTKQKQQKQQQSSSSTVQESIDSLPPISFEQLEQRNNNNNNDDDNDNDNVDVDEMIVALDDQATPLTLKNFYMIVEVEAKLSLLIYMLTNPPLLGKKILIYFLTRACVDYFHKLLSRILNDRVIVAMHGKIDNFHRKSSYKRFVESRGGLLLATDVAARGIDFPDVDWVIQFDAPQQPEALVHRVGRTARAGRVGNAALFLSPHESAFVEFAAGRRIALRELTPPQAAISNDAVEQTTQRVRSILCTDRALVDRSTTAFVSMVRAYREHALRYLFSLRQLPLGRAAFGYGLLRFPRMPETKQRRDALAGFTASDIDISEIPFADKIREQQRLENKSKKRKNAQQEDDVQANDDDDDDDQEEITTNNNDSDDNDDSDDKVKKHEATRKKRRISGAFGESNARKQRKKVKHQSSLVREAVAAAAAANIALVNGVVVLQNNNNNNNSIITNKLTSSSSTSSTTPYNNRMLSLSMAAATARKDALKRAQHQTKKALQKK